MMDETIIVPAPDGWFLDKSTGQGFCLVCRIALSSEKLANEHVKGKQHTRKLKDIFASREGTEVRLQENMMRCIICKVLLLGRSSVEEHLHSAWDKHGMRENKCQPVADAGAANGSSMTVSMTKVANDHSSIMTKTMAGDDWSLTMRKTVAVDDQSQVMSRTVAGNDQSLTMRKTVAVDDQSPTRVKAFSPGTCTGDLPSGFAEFPNSSSPDPCGQGPARILAPDTIQIFDVQSSLQKMTLFNDLDEGSSSSHCPMTEPNISPSIAGEVNMVPNTVPCEPIKFPLSCTSCSSSFSGQVSAKDHFTSEKHEIRSEIALLVAKGGHPRDLETGALKINIEGNYQYVCDVCNCLMNSTTTYVEHAQGAQHRNCEAWKKSQLQEAGNQCSGIGFPYAPQLSATNATNQTNIHTPGSGACDPQHQNILVEKRKLEVTSVTDCLEESVEKAGATGLQNAQLGSRKLKKVDKKILDCGVQNNVNSRDSSSITDSCSGSHSRKTATKMFPDFFKASQTGGSINMKGIGGLGHSHLEQVAGGRFISDLAQQMTVDHLLQGSASDMAVCHRSQNAASGTVAAKSASGSQGNKAEGHRIYLHDDCERCDHDDPRALPTFLASQSLGRPVKDDDMCTLYEDSLSFQTASGMSTVSENDVEESMYEEANSLFLTASDRSTTSGSGTLTQTESKTFGIIQEGREINRGFPEESQTQSTSKRFPISCDMCGKVMNTQKDLENHEGSFQHKKKLATVRAPDNSREPLVTCEDVDTDAVVRERNHSCMKPRSYQLHLLRKTMASKSAVVFLPTGTGKTLIATMAIDRMLTLNKTRPVLFLTDKVLLVLQQGDNIQKALGRKLFLRPCLTKEGKLEERHLKVAKLCGGLSVPDATPLWKYDVIVSSAVFFQNLLKKEILRWTNFSMVVLDEAHNCRKEHPYKVLMDSCHHRPKILGFTASPAGSATKEATLEMLKVLLKNLGGASMVAVDEKSDAADEKEAREDLMGFSSNAKLIMEYIPLSSTEKEFQSKLRQYFADAYQVLLRFSNIIRICGAEDFQNITADSLEEIDKLLKLAQSDGIQADAPNNHEKFEVIQAHVQAVGQALLSSEDGLAFVLEELDHIFDVNHNPHFSRLTVMSLPCEMISRYVKNLCDSLKFHTIEEDSGSLGTVMQHMTIFRKLLETLAKQEYVDWENPDPMVLVLVRERDVAFKLVHHLRKTDFVHQRGVQVEILVGHGAGSGEAEGMKLRKQNETLHRIRSSHCGKTITVATSVAEEGIDIPECQLVICANVPSTAKAMVQMRGRARKKNSFFVVFCRDYKEKKKLEELQLQEKNMRWAVNQLLH